MLSVLVRDPLWEDEDKLAAFLSAHLHQPLIDARRTARRGWGFLAEGMSPDEADRLAQAATSAGIPVVVLPMEKIPVLPPAAPVHRGRLSPEGFHYTVGTAVEEFLLPWASLRLLAAAALKERRSFTKTVREGPSAGQQLLRTGILLTTGIPLGKSSKEVKKTATETELFHGLDLYGFEGPVLKRLHVAAEHFHFEAWGERRRPTASANFKMLLEDVAAACPGALRNRGARGLLSGIPVARHGYDSAADVDKEARRLLALFP